jgi:putative copper export protein
MLVKCYELITRTSYSWIFLLEVLLFVDITILTTSAKYLKKKRKKKDVFNKGCPRIKCVAPSFFFTWVVPFLINKILWVVGVIKIKISCLVGKLKPTQLICVVLPQF